MYTIFSLDRLFMNAVQLPKKEDFQAGTKSHFPTENIASPANYYNHSCCYTLFL
jgi:hypothetical protein